MKKILFIILMALPFMVNAQTQPPNQTFSGLLYEFKYALRADSIMLLPQNDTIGIRPSLLAPGAIIYRIADKTFYGYDGAYWKSFSFGNIRALDSLRYDPATAAFIARYTTGGELTVQTGLVDSLQNRLKYIDTSAMLSNYIYNGNNGTVKTGKTIGLGGALLNNTTIAQSGKTITWTGNGTPASPAIDPFYLQTVRDDRIGVTGTRVMNLNSNGSSVFSLYNDSSAVVAGINGTLVAADTTNGYVDPNYGYLAAGKSTKGLLFTTINPDNRIYFKIQKDSAASIYKDYAVFYKGFAVGSSYNLWPMAGDPAHKLDIVADSTYLVQFSAYANNAGFSNMHFRKARGTSLVPLGILSGDALMSIGTRGYDGSAFSGSATAIQSIATEDYTPIRNGAMMRFSVQRNGNFNANRTIALDLYADSVFTYASTAVRLPSTSAIALRLSRAGDGDFSFPITSDPMGLGSVVAARSITFRNNTTTGDIAFASSSTAQPNLILKNNGNLLVGATSDASSKLQVNGSVALAAQTITGNTTLGNVYTNLVNNSGSVTITLPAASGCNNRLYVIKKVSAASNDVIIARTGTDTIDGGTSKTLTLQYSSVTVQSNGTNWYILSSHAAATTL